MRKPKRQNKTKEQIIADLRGNAKFQEKMTFTRDKFWPALCEATTSIDDATQNLSVINSILMEKFLGFMREKTMKDIKLVDSISDKDPKAEQMKAMIGLFDDMSVFDAKDLLEGMKNEINLFQMEEMKERPLTSLKVKWIDQL